MSGRRRKFIEPGSTRERVVLTRAIATLEGENDPERARLWHRIADQWEALEMDEKMGASLSVFSALVRDTTELYDAELNGNHGAAVEVQLERDSFGWASVDVKLSQITGSQLAFVLKVAEDHGFDVHEESGWLRLAHPLTIEEQEELLEESPA